MKRFALIPALEPDEQLISLCRALRDAGFHIVVVDDGSSAACEAVFAQAAQLADCLSHVDNLGKGAAIKTGLRHILEISGEGDVVVTADADGQHLPADVERVARAAAENPSALVLGSRSFTGAVPLRSRIGNLAARAVYRIAAHCRISDTQTGLRAFTRERIPFLLEIPGQRYEYEMNMLLLCPQRGVPLLELPIETVYIAKNASSHFRPLRDACRILRELMRFSAASLAGFCVDYLLFALLSQLLAERGAFALAATNVLARIVSAAVNFSLNRKYVFRDRGGWRSAALRYGLLALAILAGNTLLLAALTLALGLNRFAAKLAAELLLFFVSFRAQRSFVFGKGRKHPPLQRRQSAASR